MNHSDLIPLAPPDIVRVTTKRYTPNLEVTPPSLGLYRYSIYWNTLLAASCSLSISMSGEDRYLFNVAARTLRSVDILYKLRFEAQGEVSYPELAPLSIIYDKQVNSRRDRLAIKLLTHSLGTTAHTSSLSSECKNTASHSSYHFKNFTLEPLSAALLAANLDWPRDQIRDFDIFTGSGRYLVSLRSAGQRAIKHRGEARLVSAIIPQIRNLSAIRPIPSIKSGVIYLSEDGPREILKIEALVGAGSIVTELDSFSGAHEGCTRDGSERYTEQFSAAESLAGV